MAHNQHSPYGTKEDLIGWQLYAIWQETRHKIESNQFSGKRYHWYLVEPLKAVFAIDTLIT